MRRIEVRRHSERQRDGHLSPKGVALAAEVGQHIGPFARVVSSPAPRARETAEAMGFPVEEEVPELAANLSGLLSGDDYLRLQTFADYDGAMRERPALNTFAREQAGAWLRLAAGIPEGAAMLAISHGALIELGALAVLPGGRQTSWGRVLAPCEGISIQVEGATPRAIELVRVGSASR